MFEYNAEEYKKHPRVLEIRFILLFDIFEREYGYQAALKFYNAICSSFYCDMAKIMGLINKRNDIRRYAKTRRIRWRQEVIFVANLYGESLYKVAKDYLITTPENLYIQRDNYDISRFLSAEWLKFLDEETTLCGIAAYRTEVNRFFEVIDNMSNVLLRWKG